MSNDDVRRPKPIVHHRGHVANIVRISSHFNRIIRGSLWVCAGAYKFKAPCEFNRANFNLLRRTFDDIKSIADDIIREIDRERTLLSLSFAFYSIGVMFIGSFIPNFEDFVIPVNLNLQHFDRKIGLKVIPFLTSIAWGCSTTQLITMLFVRQRL